jgi:hypothetical protein
MSDYAPEPSPDETDAAVEDVPEAAQEYAQEFAEPVRTGVEEVDGVLDSVDDLEGLPVEEHVAVFENAHDRLRGALDARPDA